MPDIEIRKREDEFSLQIYSPERKMFWIRIEKPWGETVFVSDFLFDQCDTEKAWQVLEENLPIRKQVTKRIVFRDIAPDMNQTTAAMNHDTISSRIKKMMKILGISVRNVHMDAAGGKFSTHVLLA